MKKKVLIIVGIIAVAAIALLVFKPFSKKEAEYTFDTVKVEKGNITNTVTATGTIEAITTVEVGTQSGRHAGRNARRNQNGMDEG